jgi:hypothetical protein
MKNTLFLSLFLIFLLLTSCSLNKDKKKINSSVNTESKITNIKNNKEKAIEIEAIEEKRKQVYLQDMPLDEKKLFEEYDNAKKTNDKIKESDLLKKIKELEVSKRKKLDDAVKNKNDETAKKIRKELRIFSIEEN